MSANRVGQSLTVFLALSCLPSLATAGVINVPLFGQQAENWCWAGSGQMLLTFFNRPDVTQCQEANDNFHRTDCCQQPTPAACNAGSWPDWDRYNFVTKESETDTALSWEQLKAEIDAVRPFFFVWGWLDANGLPDTTGHAMVAAGYTEGPNGIQLVHIQDPDPMNEGDRYTLPYGLWVDSSAPTLSGKSGYVSPHQHVKDIYQIQPRPQFRITTASLPDGLETDGYFVTLTANLPVVSWAASGLPAGLTLTSFGTLDGDGIAAGQYTVTIAARADRGETDIRSFNLIIKSIHPIVVANHETNPRGVSVTSNGDVYWATFDTVSTVKRCPALVDCTGGAHATIIAQPTEEVKDTAINSNGDVYWTVPSGVMMCPAGLTCTGNTHPFNIATNQTNANRIVIDASDNVYWTNAPAVNKAGSVMKCAARTICGASPITIAANQNATGVAIASNGDVYWSYFDNVGGVIPPGGVIAKCPANQVCVNPNSATIIVENQTSVSNVTLDIHDNVYWANINDSTVMECPAGHACLCPVGQTCAFATNGTTIATGQQGAFRVEADGAKSVYWVDFTTTGALMSCPSGRTCGSRPTKIASAASQVVPYDVTVDRASQNVYWATLDMTGGNNGSVMMLQR